MTWLRMEASGILPKFSEAPETLSGVKFLRFLQRLLRRVAACLLLMLGSSLLPVAAFHAQAQSLSLPDFFGRSNQSTQVSLPDPVSFSLAVERGEHTRVAAWLEAGLPADFLGERIGTGLMIAAWEGDIPMMALFVQHGAQIGLNNRYDEDALLLAAWRGHLPAVQWLLEQGAEVQRGQGRWTALHYASFANHARIVELLLHHGAEINAQAPNGSSVLMMAAREGHAELARQLLTAGADTQIVNDRGDSALTWAMRHGHFSLARLVSTQGEFAQAARAGQAGFGKAQRSHAAPAEINDILRQIRQAEAAGQPVAALRANLYAAAARYRQDSQRVIIGAENQTSRDRPAALRISAPAGNTATPGAERAELIYSSEPKTGYSDSEISRILAQLQQAQKRGQWRQVNTLRQQLHDAVKRAKQAP